MAPSQAVIRKWKEHITRSLERAGSQITRLYKVNLGLNGINVSLYTILEEASAHLRAAPGASQDAIAQVNRITVQLDV